MSLFTNGTTSFGNSTSGSLSADCTLFNEAFPDFAQYDGFSDCSAFNFYQDDQGDITSFFLNDGSFDYPIQINGPIPDSFADLTYLTYLSLTNANITSVGTEICTFTALTALDLSGNSFPSLPDCISDLAQLQYLTLSFSGLTKLTTGVCEITPLSSIDLSYNSLSSIPDCVGQQTNLAYLYLDYNQLTSLPDFSQISGLAELSASNNRLSGGFPSGLDANQNLDLLDLSSNQLSGSIPDWTWNYDTYSFLNEFQLQNNFLTGTLPMDALMVFGPGSFEINCFTNDNLISQPNCKGKVLAAAPAGIANIAAKGPPTGPAPTAPALPPAQVQNIVSNLGTALNSTGLLVNTTQLSSTLTASSVSLSSSGSTPLTGGSIASSNTGANTVIVNIVTPLLIFSDATTSDTYGALTSSNISSTTTSDGVNFHYLLPSSIGSVWYVFQTSTPGQITIIVNSAKTALGSITFPTQAASHRRDLSATSSSITVQQAYAPYKVRNTVSSQYHKAIANPNAGHPSVPKPQNKGSKPGKKPTATGKGKTGKGKTTGTPQDCSKFKKGNKITNKKAYQACLAYNKKLKGKTTATTKGKTSTGKHAPAVSTKGAKKPKYTTYKKTPKKASTKTKVSPKKTTTYTTVTKSAKKSPKKPKAPKKNSPASHAR